MEEESPELPRGHTTGLAFINDKKCKEYDMHMQQDVIKEEDSEDIAISSDADSVSAASPDPETSLKAASNGD